MSVPSVCDDTYVFVLLFHYYNSRCKGSNSAPMIMSSPVKERAVIYIRATVEAHSDIADDLLQFMDSLVQIQWLHFMA